MAQYLHSVVRTVLVTAVTDCATRSYVHEY